VYCAALWDRLEGVTSIVPLAGSCLARRNILQHFLSKFWSVCIMFDCLLSLLDGWTAEAKVTCFVIVHTWYYLKLFQKNKQEKTLYKSFISDVFVIHHLKTKHTVCTASTVHVCHWVLITAVGLARFTECSNLRLVVYTPYAHEYSNQSLNKRHHPSRTTFFFN